MIFLFTLISCIALSFLYTLLYKGIAKLTKNAFVKKHYNYLWAIIVLIIALVYPNSLLRDASLKFLTDREIIDELLTFVFFAVILGFFSGYKTVGKKYDFDFCFIFPLFEEILFRGVILILLVNSGVINESFAGLIAAILFGIMHFQYFGLKKSSIRFVVIAFVGGYYFSMITLMTNSILPSLFLHMAFNMSAIVFSKVRNKTISLNK